MDQTKPGVAPTPPLKPAQPVPPPPPAPQSPRAPVANTTVGPSMGAPVVNTTTTVPVPPPPPSVPTEPVAPAQTNPMPAPSTPPAPGMVPPPPPSAPHSSFTPPPQTPSGLPPQPPQTPPQSNTPPSSSRGRGKLGKILAIIIGLLIVVGGGVAAFFFVSNQNQPQSTNPNSNTPVKQVALEYWGLWEPSSVMASVIAEFEAQHPGVTINYTQSSPVDYRERLQSALASGRGPDIFRYHNTWVPMFVNQLDTVPGSVMSAATFEETFYPVVSEDLATSDGYVGIPLMIDGLGLFYNKTMFETAGLNPPTSWDELRATAKALAITQDGKLQRGGIALGTTGNVDNLSDILGVMLLQEGVNPASPLDSGAANVFTFYQIFSREDKVWDTTMPPSTYAFATGKVAMIIAPSWRAHEIAQVDPNLEFAIVPIPQLPEKQVAWASYWVEGVSSQSKNREVAWQFLNYLNSRETLRRLYTDASNERLFGEPFARVDMADQLLGDPYVGAYIQQAPYAVSWPMAGATHDNGLNERIIKYYEDALNAGGTQEARETLSRGVNQVLSQYGVSAAQ